MRTRLISIVILSVLCGYLVGRIMSFASSRTPSSITVTDSVSLPKIATVEIAEIRDGKLYGSLHGDVRFFLGKQQIIPNGSGAIVTSADALLTSIVTVYAPGGARFVASRKGKRFYPVDSSAGQKLSPANRIYFQTEEDARKAGYR